ncbi:MAG: GNAT family N-acetyltransferase [Desulfobacula sp.]|nr:GNAT family N-acetyltransferase [Desulfobacula sp.]
MYIELLNRSNIDLYQKFLNDQECSLVYFSPAYKALLSKLLKCPSYYLLACENGRGVLGVLPIFIKRSLHDGNVANSLPFYGSNGSVLLDANCSNEKKKIIRRMLIDKGQKIVEQNECASFTLITSPLETDLDWYKLNFDYTFTDYRIGQLSMLPEGTGERPVTLMDAFAGMRRRNIRKALKSGIKVRVDNSLDGLTFLWEIHKRNIEKIGGIPKELSFFEQVHRYMSDNYRLYTAWYKGERAAGLLLFYYNKTVEYYTPAIVEEYRTFQPLCLTIYDAMKDAVAMGFRYWNWGGTWSSQKGVYEFKKRWGAVDLNYYYFTKLYQKEVLTFSKDRLLNAFPNFYVVPFRELTDS